MLQRVTTLFDASLMNRMVLVPLVLPVEVLLSVSAFAPSIVTLSAPFRLIMGEAAVVAPEMVHDPPEGCITRDAQGATLWSRLAEAVPSLVLPVMVMTMLAPP